MHIRNGKTIDDRVLFPGENKSGKIIKSPGGVVTMHNLVNVPTVQEMRKIQRHVGERKEHTTIYFFQKRKKCTARSHVKTGSTHFVDHALRMEKQAQKG